MAATTLYSFAATPLPTGVTAIPVTPVTGYTSQLSIILNAAVGANALAWASAATTVAIALEVSYDGGVTYLPGGACGITGGGATGTNLGNGANMGAIFSYSAVPTHVQGSITITNGALSLSGSITVQ